MTLPTIEEAKAQLEKQKDLSKMGPFSFMETGTVIKRGHKMFGARAHLFHGNYHRHTFYVFGYGKAVEFINTEDKDPLW